jgi:UDP-N-acetyl-D-mannosaminuronic acid dehydrogenase
MKVCVVGLGQIGFPVAQYVSEKGLEVWGIDINPATVESMRTKQVILKPSTRWKDIPQCDIYIIAVTTGQKNDAPDLTAVFEVSKKHCPKRQIHRACSHRKHHTTWNH